MRISGGDVVMNKEEFFSLFTVNKWDLKRIEEKGLSQFHCTIEKITNDGELKISGPSEVSSGVSGQTIYLDRAFWEKHSTTPFPKESDLFYETGRIINHDYDPAPKFGRFKD